MSRSAGPRIAAQCHNSAIAIAVDDLSRGYSSDGAVGSVFARAWSRVK